jgi:hypothetical protein
LDIWEAHGTIVEPKSHKSQSKHVKIQLKSPIIIVMIFSYFLRRKKKHEFFSIQSHPGTGHVCQVRQENALKEAAQRQLVILEGDEKRRTTYPGGEACGAACVVALERWCRLNLRIEDGELGKLSKVHGKAT